MYDKNNIFAKILRKEIPCEVVYEDDQVLFFYDFNLKNGAERPKNSLKIIQSSSRSTSWSEKRDFSKIAIPPMRFS